MANQTVTTVVNYDDAAISGLLNGETLTINGGSVTIDADVRWNQQAAVLGNVTLSFTLGGSFLIDGTKVWEVPFSASTGNVPTQAALGSNGVTGATSGATGELLRVWATGSLDPSAAGGAMPATGWIKLRSKTGTFQSGETITLPGGATITASGAGKRSWIHVVGASAKTLTNSGLGLAQYTGDWYEIGTTDGSDGQTFQFPVADRTPAIWIETAPGSNQYEIWLGAADFWVNGGISTDVRGKYFGMTAATGQIIIAQRTGLTAGYKPASGCRVRVPNVILSIALSTNYAANENSATITNFPGSYQTSNGGTFTCDKVASNWHATFDGGGSIQIANSAWHSHSPTMFSKETISLTNVGFGCLTAQVVSGLNFSGCLAGITATDVVVSRPGNNGSAAILFTSCKDVSLTRVTTNTPLLGVSAFNYGCGFFYCQKITMNDCAGVYGFARFVGTVGIDVINFSYAGRQVGNSTAGDNTNAIRFENGCQDIFVDGYSHFNGLPNVGPGNALIYATNSSIIEVRNIGSTSAPLNLYSITGNSVAAATVENIACRRIYTTNNRAHCYSILYSNGVEILNFWGGIANRPVIQSDNMTARNVSFGELDTVNSVGTHWADTFYGTTGRLYLFMHPPSVSSVGQCVATLNSGVGSAFTKASSVRLLSLTDTITWTMPYYMLGVTGFSGSPVLSGTNTGNFLLEFQRDLNDGNGFGAWQTLNAANLAAITVNPALGIKLKIRVTVTVANSANLLGTIYIPFVTNATAIATQYPLPTTLNVAQISNLVAGSRVQVYNVTTATEVANEIVGGTTWSLEYNEGTNFTTGNVIRVRVTKQSGATAYLPFLSLALAGSTGWTVLASQEVDTVYNAIGVDGSTVTEFAPDYPNVQVDISDANGQTSVDRLYSWFVHTTTTESGIRNWFGGIVAEDAANFRVATAILNLKLDNVSATGVEFTGGHRLYRDDNASPLVSSTSGGGSITLFAGKVFIAETGVSGLTGAESAKLMGLPSAGDTAAAVWNTTLP